MQLEKVSISGPGPISSANESPPVGNLMPQRDRSAKDEARAAELVDMKAIAAAMQKNLKVFHNVDLHFSVHQASGQVMVVVTDEDSGKIIREIPSAEILNLAAKLEEMMGIIFDQQA